MNKEQLLKKVNFDTAFNKLSELKQCKPYTIRNFEFVKTKYSKENAESVIANLDEFRVFLPKRYALSFDKSELQALVKHGVKLVYYGITKSKNGKDMHNIKFV